MYGTDQGRKGDHGRIPLQAVRSVVAQTDMLAVVREVVELIMKSQNLWIDILKRYEIC